MNDQAYPDALKPQYRLHWYTIERVLGQGGFGITYLARDANLDQLVAIKEYLPVEVVARGEDGRVRSRGDGQRERYRWGLDRFIQEARTLARFDHPSIVRVHSVFEFNGTAYMVMRFEEGENFGALLERRGTLPEKDLLRVLLPILDGLDLVHGAGFIHRDIKPDNIHIRADGSPVLLDFGSARHALGKSRTLTILVAPGYAPFEQYGSNSENQGPWTDIYGLGATCYRAITGTPPLDAITRSKGILGSTREVLVPARTIGSGRYSSQLLAAIDHSLEFTEKGRPQTVAEWRREILGEAIAAKAAPAAPERLVPVEPEKVAPPAVPPPAFSAPAAPPDHARAGWLGARAPLAWAVSGAAAGAIAIAVFLQMDNPRRDQEEKVKQEQLKLDKELTRIQDEIKRSGLELKSLQKEREFDVRRVQEEKERLAELQKQAEKLRTAAAAPRKPSPELAPLTKPKPRPEMVPIPPSPTPAPPTLAPLVELEPGDTPPVVAMAKPKPAPQADPLAKAEGALARGDYTGAREILVPLAQSGNTQAQIRLAEMHASGKGVSRNYIQAYIWYSLATRGGSTTAQAERDRMAKLMQPAEVKQADEVVDGMRAP